ncbi:50S ribosomal protein L13 [Candidatus Shapirobacteria bacterium CG10_big_fil_rev_8_21_14_0_10_38_14]|uniref:Large ribosomal subunit protein uL13 n=1 Tax=Candidatus Shapirobacteria bacterium CG10_big_fil_rev_8_21_14_0_10_38_14 TaxID=1974483 RepID=A0A2M8L5Q1_9BACT|nr:MAG: 50S ribosomal protein L13 [Candidatus Shapirobacteria bacterium CG10_big_fil_rev_8_21_14_0_10_38_14]
MKTKTIKKSEIERKWHLVDAQNKILGRLAGPIARFLIGKDKANFVSYLDCGDYVVVVNAAEIKVTGRKSAQKKYYRHSGYPGGFRETTFKQQMEKDPRKIIRHAVSGMLPKNKFRDPRLARLKIFIDKKHPYENKI